MKGAEHPTPETLARWRARSLTPRQVLTVSDHLAECPPCRQAVEDSGYEGELAEAVDRHLEHGRAATAHLSPEQLMLWTDGNVEEIEAERLRAHLAECAACRDLTDDLASFAGDLGGARTPPTSAPAVTRWRAGALAAAAALVVLLSALVGWRLVARPLRGHVSHRQQHAPPTPMARAPEAMAAAAAVLLHDGDREIRIGTDGTVEGVPSEWRHEVAALLHEPNLTPPAVAVALALAADPERGPPAAADEVRLEAPVSTVVLETRPLFRWRGPAAASYQVDVFDQSFTRLSSSGPLDAQQWRPTVPLPAGQELIWTVTMMQPGAQPKAFPKVPAAPAELEVVGPPEAAAVASARAARSHLLLGLALWRAGLVDEAATELAALLRENPDSAFARRLAASSVRGAADLRARRTSLAAPVGAASARP